MSRFFPSAANQISKRRLVVVSLVLALAVGWIIYSFLTNDTRWENYFVVTAFIFLMVAFNIADSFWPVISINGQTVTQHRTLWLPKQHPLNEIDDMSEDGQFLYANKSGKKLVIDLSRLNNADREAIRQMTQDADRSTPG